MKYLLTVFLMSSLIINAQNKPARLGLPDLFSDNMVLQQKSDVTVWGRSDANKNILIKGSWGASVKTKSDEGGKWSAKIKTAKAGGPYELTVTDGINTITRSNVLLGEVWLCSGQSNMEMPLSGFPPSDLIENSAEEIQNANYPDMRMFFVQHDLSAYPKENCTGDWKVCTPENAPFFSATAYFFGRKLSKELNVPVGLIKSTWSGTPVQSWISGKELLSVPEYKSYIENIPSVNKEQQKLLNWLSDLKAVDLSGRTLENLFKGLDLEDDALRTTDYDDSKWNKAVLPVTWDKLCMANFDGFVWFRKQITVPHSWVGKELLLTLGAIDDMDVTYVNGVKVGGYETGGYWLVSRDYTVPAELVKNNKLTIAIRVADNFAGGGFYSLPENFKIHLKGTTESLSLAGEWKYLPVAEIRGLNVYLFGKNEKSFANRPDISVELNALYPSTLYNGLIAPLAPYKIKGAIWYQGESNIDNPELYKKTFPLMIDNWRKDWNDQFSFYYTQIAPYRYGPGTNSQYLREAQLHSMSVSKSGMAVTLDVGNPDNIHPGNKNDVGERLALWALAKDYKKKVVYSGPLYKSNKILKDKIEISFQHADGLKLMLKNGVSNFTIAGSDMKFYAADVKINGSKIIVSSTSVKEPKAVRYCWSDTDEGTLFNSAGLPASSFRTDDWPEIK